MPRSTGSLVIAAFLLAPAAIAQTADPAVVPVQALDDGLLQIMKNARQLGFQGRAARIGPVVDRAFDLPLMTRLSAGPGWTTIAPADQASLVAAFRRMTIAEYARNFTGWSGQAFAIDPKVEARGADRLVRTRLTAPKGDPVSLSYRLRQTDGGWRIIDVFYQNSISQIATRRADFAAILSRGGAKALIAHLDRQSAKAGG